MLSPENILNIVFTLQLCLLLLEALTVYIPLPKTLRDSSISKTLTEEVNYRNIHCHLHNISGKDMYVWGL